MHQALDDAMEQELYEGLDENLENQAGAASDMQEEMPEVENDLDTDQTPVDNVVLDQESANSIVMLLNFIC